MNDSKEVIELDYDSPIEQLLSFAGSYWMLGLTAMLVWPILICPSKPDDPPLREQYPVMPFVLAMLLIWLSSLWLKGKYDVRYQLNPQTQQLQLVRKILGHTFRTPVCEFSQLYAAGVLSTFIQNKEGRHWRYALCLVTRAARLLRVSSYGLAPPNEKAAEIAQTLGLQHFECQPEAGTMEATLDLAGNVVIACRPPRRSLPEKSAIFVVLVLGLFLVVAVCTFVIYALMLQVTG
ncbi:MAG: hypothetical protein U0931_29235 [Vulcanimicrobiota bacterium]